MIDYFFDFQNYLLYLVLFPVYLLAIFLFFFFGKRKIKDNKVDFHGMFLELSTIKTLALSFLLFYYYIAIVSIFLNHYSYINVLLLAVPILLFHILNLSFIQLIADIVQTAILSVLLYSKSIFFDYIVNVASYWYVIVLFVALCIFIFLFATYIFIKGFKSTIMVRKLDTGSTK